MTPRFNIRFIASILCAGLLIATLAGVIPTAYLIVKFGEVLITADSRGLTIALVLISGITLLPLLAKRLWARKP